MSVESDDDGWYVDAVAPLMLFQLPNIAFHCCHWYVYVGAGLPDHDPVLHASVGAGEGNGEVDEGGGAIDDDDGAHVRVVAVTLVHGAAQPVEGEER